jgi:uncharacterized membrane protein
MKAIKAHKGKCLFPICSHKPERAPRIGKYVFPLCYRCTGLILGYFITLFIPNAEKSILIGMALISTLMIDVAFQYLGSPSTNTRRLITGMLFSIGLLVLGMRN